MDGRKVLEFFLQQATILLLSLFWWQDQENDTKQLETTVQNKLNIKDLQIQLYQKWIQGIA